MFARALTVLLLVLNVGVASWWTLRSPPPPPVPAQPRGSARLQLPGEAPPRLAGTPPPLPAASASPRALLPASAGARQCFSIGPFATRSAAAAARARLQPMASRIVTRAQAVLPPRGWRVVLPPLPSPQAAQAEARRLAAAGFSDFQVMGDGPEANAIALGRYRGQDSARRRADALVAAGFAARAEPLGAADATTWLDVVVAAQVDPAQAQAAAAAAQRRVLDCARLP